MVNPLVECIPNFSDARRPEVIDEIIAAIRSIDEVTILDRHSDLDHNRTVVTLIGAPTRIEEAMFQAIRKAAELIDLNQHKGEHPRIGATDVVPFVPIRDVTMQECVEIAQRLGKRVGDDLGIPVYLYEEAAQRPARKNLEDIRRGEYEALKEEIGCISERTPDYGPIHVGPAGATVIGAREPLIAFNVYLATDDVSIAVKIARSVRNSGGGLRYVKAMGVLVDGRAQVSMNLTNFRLTPIHQVVEMVRREAGRYGVIIHHSELVGLIPQRALVDTAIWYTQMDQFEPEQILETRLQDDLTRRQIAPAIDQLSFLDELARGTAAPGGGSASAFAGAAATALVAMVARLTSGRKKYAAVDNEMRLLAQRAEGLRTKLTASIQLDATAFQKLMAANRLPKDTPEQQILRDAAVQSATFGAIQIPIEVATGAVEALEMAVQVAALGNLNAISDAAAGAALARAALTGAGVNVRINCIGLRDQHAVKDFLATLAGFNARASKLEDELNELLITRGGLVQ